MPIPTSQNARLKVIIVGAGIGGFACGVALRDIADVTIVESTAEIKEIGAAVHLAPNAYRLIKGWGGDLITGYGSVLCTGYTEFTPEGKKVIDAKFSTLDAVGTEWVLCHRVDVQRELRRLATEGGSSSPPCELVLGTRIVACDPEEGTVTSDKGEVFRGDVIIAADGIRSKLRPYVVGPKYQPIPSNHSAYRMLVPAEKIRAHPDLEALGLLDGKITIVNGGERRIITYPCRNSTLLNFVCALPDVELNEISEQNWTAKGDVGKMVKSYENFDPVFQKLLSLGEGPGLWQLRDQDPLPNWVKGRMILIGDAAHPMLPHQGQGASQALEDAEALGAFLRGVTADQVPETLVRVFKVRYNRASLTQKNSRMGGLAKKAEEGEAPVPIKTIDPLQFRDFSWRYYGAERWEKEQPDFVLP